MFIIIKNLKFFLLETVIYIVAYAIIENLYIYAKIYYRIKYSYFISIAKNFPIIIFIITFVIY
jgi:hypothetical protein